MPVTVFIKNMVCPRCISVVNQVFEQAGLRPMSIRLGEVELSDKLTENDKASLNEALEVHGFALLEPGKSALITQIKSIIIEQIHYSKASMRVNLSTLLSEKLHQEYSSLSRLFSTVEGITIEKYTTAQKIERVKELLFYDEKTLSEIAHILDYSSVAHLSAQFKKETGMTPSAFKKQKRPERKGLDL